MAQAIRASLPDDAKSVAERARSIVSKMQRDAADRVARRGAIEAEWIRDLEQYHGRYDSDILKKVEKVGGSRLFVPMTRPKTNAMAARLMDLLFPTDDRNWDIQPTPVPTMKGGGAQQIITEATPNSNLDALRAQALEASRLMAEEMDDQLVECNYQSQCRDMIDDACKIGTGVMEGPIASDSIRRGWVKGKNNKYTLVMGGDERPGYNRIDPWAFFPESDARTVYDSENNLVRYLWKAKDLRDFAKIKKVDKAAIRQLLTVGPREPAPSYLSMIRTLTSSASDTMRDIYQAWKFTGYLTGMEMRDLATVMGDQSAYNYASDIDPLEEKGCTLWFCQNYLLKYGLHPLDSGECLYSVFNLEKDEASIWGYGVPRMMRDPQAALNAAWRMLMDNGGLATGDQIIVNRKHIQPMDGDWRLTPRKIWELSDDAAQQDIDVASIFSNFAINSHLTDIAGIIELCYRQIDDGSGIPQIAQGQPDGQELTPTPVGTEVLRQNGANIMFRRIVKNFDDDVTVPNIRRLYDWNMQFSPRDEIKGDYDVKAIGSSVLLVREMQQINLTSLALQFGGHPVYGKYLKSLDLLREVFRSYLLQEERFVLNDDDAKQAEQMEAEQQQAAMAAQAGGTEDPQVKMRELAVKQAEIDAKVQIENMNNHTRLQVANIQHETAMMSVAEKLNMSRDQLAAMLKGKQMDISSKERSTAAEIAVRSSPQQPLNETQIANQ